MKKMVLGSCVAALIAGVAIADTVTSVNVVGYYNLTLAGDPSLPQYTLISVPMTQMPVDRGTITANTDSTLTVAGAGWSAGQFAPPTDWIPGNEAQENTYFVEIVTDTSGVFSGRQFVIAGNTDDTLTLAAAVVDLTAGDLVDATYKIYPAMRLSGVFGVAPDVVLTAGAELAAADAVMLWDVDQQRWDSKIFAKTDRTGAVIGWFQGSLQVDDMPLHRDHGMLVYRLAGAEDVQVTVAGEVSGNVQSIPIEPGYSLQNGMVAVDTPLSQSGLDSVLAGAAEAAEADTLRPWDTVNSRWGSSIYLKLDRNGDPIGWFSGPDQVDDYLLEAGKGYLFLVKDARLWERESPLAK